MIQKSSGQEYCIGAFLYVYKVCKQIKKSVNLFTKMGVNKVTGFCGLFTHFVYAQI